MIVYNVTVKIDHEIHDDWVRWMQAIHIPDVLATGLFEGYRMHRLLFPDEEDGVSYAIQYLCRDIVDYHRYQLNHAPALQKAHSERYEGHFFAFRTLLELVAEEVKNSGQR